MAKTCFACADDPDGPNGCGVAAIRLAEGASGCFGAILAGANMN